MAGNGKLAVVTGSSRGIGKEIAQSLLDQSWEVFFTGRGEKDVVSAASEKKAASGKAHTFVGDLSLVQNLASLKERVLETQTPLELLVANMGGGVSSGEVPVPFEEFHRIFEINLFSAVKICEVLAPLMKTGNLIFISSIAGCETIGAPPAYSAAKAALLSYSKSLADIFARKNIRVNSISPGNVLFPDGNWDKKSKADPKKIQSILDEKVPLRRFLTPSDIAQGVHFILSSPNFTGQNLIIDAGQVRGFV